jgi:hypothetical protein
VREPSANPNASELAALYIHYLASGRSPQATERLAPALAAAGLMFEAAALGSASGAALPDALAALLPGAGSGARWPPGRLWMGSQLPGAARVGDLWLDTCQLTPMLLVPRPHDPASAEPYAWIDLRPMQRWQVAGVLALATFEPREVQLPPPLGLLDSRRMLHGAPTEAATDLVPDEARLCANWFAKGICGAFAWYAARMFLPEQTFAALWGASVREWAGEYAEGEFLVLTPATAGLDPAPDGEDEDEDGVSALEPQRTLLGEWAHSRETSFRASALVQLGLFREIGADGAWYLPHRLSTRLPR